MVSYNDIKCFLFPKLKDIRNRELTYLQNNEEMR